MWESRVPIPTYLMVVGVAPMEVLDQGVGACGSAPASPRADGCVEVTAWAFPPDTAFAREVFGRSGEMLDVFAEMFGPYPFEKLANVQAATRFGGMENASAIFYSEAAIAQRRDIEDTVAHEIVHQWFGNAVTPADWPHLWLSEGFATYFAAVFRERTEGADAFQLRLERMRERVLTSGVVDRPVVDTDAANLMDLLNANSYQKGALVLHMLRWVVGDRTFFSQVRHYYQRHAGGNATTANLQAAFDEAGVELLDWFFRQWLHSPGYPVYRTAWSWDERTRRANVTIRQEQSDAWPTFRMPIEIEFGLEGGVHRVTHWVDGREWAGEIALPSRPTRMTLDPDGWLLMRQVDPQPGPVVEP
jgi:aminopeptidase N